MQAHQTWTSISRSDVSREPVTKWNSLPGYCISFIFIAPLQSNARKNKEATVINHGLQFLAGNVWTYALMKVVVLGLPDHDDEGSKLRQNVGSCWPGNMTWPPTRLESNKHHIPVLSFKSLQSRILSPKPQNIFNYEIICNTNLMQQNKFINVFLARLVSGT